MVTTSAFNNVRYMAIPALVLFVVGTFVVLPILHGWALSILWAWFVAPTFSLPNLSVAAAIGLTLTLQVLIRTDYDEKRYEKAELGEIMVAVFSKGIVAPIMALAFGYLVKQFL